MKFTNSLKKNAQFRFVYSKGRSCANKFLVLYAAVNGTGFNKLGVCVSKKVGGSVVRSRVKRLTKESYRLMEQDVKTGYDLVFIARQAAAAASYKDIETAVRRLLQKQDLIRYACINKEGKDYENHCSDRA